MKISKALYQQKQWNHLENIEKGYKKCKELLKQPYDNSRKVFSPKQKGNLNSSKVEVEEQLQNRGKKASIRTCKQFLNQPYDCTREKYNKKTE